MKTLSTLAKGIMASTSAALAVAANSQSLPSECPPGPPLQILTSATPGEAKLWESTAVHASGRYLEVSAPPGYGEIVRHLLGVAQRQTKVQQSEWRPPADLSDEYALVSIFPESPYRVTAFYEASKGEFAMLTRWRFGAQGARLCVREQFLNVSFGASRGTLALAKSQGAPRQIWKLTWFDISNEIQFELYVEDAGSRSGIPDLAIDIARSLIQ